MKLIKKIHYHIVYLFLILKKVEPHFAKVMAEQFIYFKYKK